MFDDLIEFDMKTVIALALGAVSIVGMYLLFGFWATKGFSPKLHIKIACYVFAPIASYFIVQWQANKE